MLSSFENAPSVRHSHSSYRHFYPKMKFDDLNIDRGRPNDTLVTIGIILIDFNFE